MASNFSANQFESAFCAKNLCNWEVPKWYPKHPRRRNQVTKIISNDRGHLLPNIERPKTSPWGHFKGTWELPGIITREQANELSKPQVGGSRWAMPDLSKMKIKTEIKQEEEKLDFQSFSPEDEEETNILGSTPEALNDVKPKMVRVFNEKEKLNNPIAISQQARRSIRHETLERDHDEH